MSDRYTDALVEYQARWAELKRQAGVETSHHPDMSHEGPYITISRQLGAGGTDVAHRVAKPLGWRVVDRELLSSIATLTETSEEAVSARDEKASGIFDDYLSHLLLPDDLSHGGYLRQMTRLVASFAREGRVIILGRGANWFLHPARGLRIRIVAPFDVRVAAVVAHEGLSEQAARAKVRAHDAEQRAYVKQSFGKDIDDPIGYDYVLNTGALSLELAADCVASSLARKLGGHL